MSAVECKEGVGVGDINEPHAGLGPDMIFSGCRGGRLGFGFLFDWVFHIVSK